MKSRFVNIAEEGGLAAASRRFPTRSLLIQKLMAVDESFRGMCDDLAAAEHALATVDQLPAHIRNERREEFAGLAESLALEIETALSQSENLH
jgi:hypothetical protein